MIEARVICDSIAAHSPRLTTFLTRYPKFIHAEHMRHRTGSYCVSSSRAVPVAKNMEEVRSDELRAAPVWWGREQKGMSSGEELDDTPIIGAPSGRSEKEAAQYLWQRAAKEAYNHADAMRRLGAHKSIVNRLLEPFLHVNVLWTTCEPGLMNFFGLRLDRAAQPEMRVLAEAVWKAWNESEPKKLEPGQWHLPFVEDQDIDECRLTYVHRLVGYVDPPDNFQLRALQRISAARCARLSYLSFETSRRSTIEEDLALYERLVGSHPIHASPAEHQATPDKYEVLYNPNKPFPIRPELHGNLPGWVQYRKTLPGESIAPLPEGYAR